LYYSKKGEDMFDTMFMMRAVWLLTSLGAIRLGAKAMGFDYFSHYKQAMKIADCVFGVAGVVSLINFFMY
jgi:hypothetical protein